MRRGRLADEPGPFLKSGGRSGSPSLCGRRSAPGPGDDRRNPNTGFQQLGLLPGKRPGIGEALAAVVTTMPVAAPRSMSRREIGCGECPASGSGLINAVDPEDREEFPRCTSLRSKSSAWLLSLEGRQNHQQTEPDQMKSEPHGVPPVPTPAPGGPVAGHPCGVPV